jgi:outer membrane protein assembly factor BamE
MKKIIAVAVIGVATLLQGCAATDQLTSSVTSSVQNFGKSETGTYISPETMRAFVDHKTTEAEVVAAVGHPQSRQDIGKREVWSYGYTKLSSFSKNVSETAVFEFDRNGVLQAHYKTTGASSSENALTKAAGM